MLDCIIRNARVIDGTGAPWHRGDIGVAGGKVAMIGNLSGMTGKVEYDAHDHYLAPGFIDTDMTAKIDKEGNQLAGMIPLKRMGRPEDVANLAVFLAGNGSDYITGEVIRVDGGLAM